jgi:hypothetical protein
LTNPAECSIIRYNEKQRERLDMSANVATGKMDVSPIGRTWVKPKKYPFELKPYPWKEYVDANTPKPRGIRGMHFIEFGFVNINDIDKGEIKDNYGRLNDNITAADLEPIVTLYENGEYDFAGFEPPVIADPSGVCGNKLVAGEHRLEGKRLTLHIDISKGALLGGEWLFVAICKFDNLEALRDYSFAENNKKLSFVKRFSSYDSSIANIGEYLKTLEPKYRTKAKVLAKLKEVSWDGCEIGGVYVKYTNADKEIFAEDCLKFVGVKVEPKKRYNHGDVVSEFIDEGYRGVTKKHPEDDPNTYIGNFKGVVSETGFDPNFIRATESLIPKILKGEDVNIIAYVDARSKNVADKIRKKIVANYFKNIIKTSYGLVALDIGTSLEDLKNKSKGNLGKVTFYFCKVFKDDPLFTIEECEK